MSSIFRLGASNILEFNQFFGGLTDSFHTNEIYDDVFERIFCYLINI